MGMPVAVDVRDARPRPAELDAAFAWLREVDATVQHLPRRQRDPPAGPAASWRSPTRDPRSTRCWPAARRCGARPAATSAAPRAARWTRPASSRAGRVDARGRAPRAPRARLCIDAGGDVVRARRRRGGWGSATRASATALAAVLEVQDGAVATSGAYERGAHIVDPHTGRPPRGVAVGHRRRARPRDGRRLRDRRLRHRRRRPGLDRRARRLRGDDDPGSATRCSARRGFAASCAGGSVGRQASAGRPTRVPPPMPTLTDDHRRDPSRARGPAHRRSGSPSRRGARRVRRRARRPRGVGTCRSWTSRTIRGCASYAQQHTRGLEREVAASPTPSCSSRPSTTTASPRR